MTRTDLEIQLGPPQYFMINAGNRHLVVAWALAAGFPSVQVHSMGNVQLANLYCEYGGKITEPDVRETVAQAVIDTAKALAKPAAPTIDLDAVRAIVREEIDARLPVPLTITTPRGTVTLDGPMHYATQRVIRTVARNHPVMMVGPAGCGKTTIGEHTAKALQLSFYITNVVNEEYQLMGFVDGNGKYHSTPFRCAFEQGGVWIADEIDAWEANALLAANSALANGYATFPDVETPIRRHEDFRMVATANTFGVGADRMYVGRNELDAASLDRFALIEVDYDLELERWFAGGDTAWLLHVWDVRETVQEKKIRHVVSSRAISMGTVALADGDAWDDVVETYLLKGMSKQDRSKL